MKKEEIKNNDSSFPFDPLRDVIVVELQPKTITKGGILLPDNKDKDANLNDYCIVALGERITDARLKVGTYIKLRFNGIGYQSLVLDSKPKTQYILVDEHAILGVFKK